MTYVCPKCQSPRIRSNDYAKKICAFIGTVAGALSASSQAGRYTMGAVNRFVVGRFPIPPIGRSANTIINALVAGTAGGAAGARLGEFIDTQILKNFQCLDCKHTFNAKDFLTDETDEYDELAYFRAQQRTDRFRPPYRQNPYSANQDQWSDPEE